MYPLRSWSFLPVNFISYNLAHDIQNIYNPSLGTYTNNESYDYYVIYSFIYVEI